VNWPNGELASWRIDALRSPVAPDDLEQLTDLLLDVVDGGASVSFMAGLARDAAREWWRRTVASADTRAIILAARDASGIVGSVQLQPAWAPNQPHRGDVAKLLVHRRARRRGLARALMAELETRAAANRFTLLVLDTCQGTPAEALYRGLGWTEAGIIPHFALTPDGGNCDTVFFYKELSSR
jgi:ribosomal protein S18 acetylase RimI-like enzyme